MGEQDQAASPIEVLSLGYVDVPVECSRARWWEIFRDYERMARSHVANLAAHNWDVLLVGGRVFLFQTRYGGELGHWIDRDGTREDATAKQMLALYNSGSPRRRKFETSQPPVSHDQ